MKDTLLNRLNKWAQTKPSSPAQYYKHDQKWYRITAQEYWDRVCYLAVFLDSRGFTFDDIGTILAYNSPAWTHFELGCLLAGGRCAGVYPNSSPKDILYIITHTESKFFAVQNKAYFDKLENHQQEVLNNIKLMLVLEGDATFSDKAISYEYALNEGKRLVSLAKINKFLEHIDPKAGSFIIYTSGTTGIPKGALMSHDNFTFTIDQVKKHWQFPETATLFSFLPLCHVAEKLQSIAAGISFQYPSYYCSEFEKLSQELEEVQPTLLLCVPRVWEKMMEAVQQKISAMRITQQKFINYAFKVAEKKCELELSNEKVPLTILLQTLAFEKLVFAKIKTALGLKNAVLLACGAGGLPTNVWKFFKQMGIQIQEDFGQTESTGVICMTKPNISSPGLSGFPVSQIEVKITDGEICARGKNVFVGYFKDPKTTSETIDEEGWLKSGDLGYWTENGQLKITGRKKEILKTSGGKFIAPVPIEDKLKESELISQVCVVGDNQKFPAALIVPSQLFFEKMKQKGISLGEEKTLEHMEIKKEIGLVVEKVNQTLAHYEQIKKFLVLKNELTVASGELTPTLKLKRRVIQDRYSNLIEALYKH